MQLALVGLSHKSAPVDVRERLAFPAEVQADALSQLLSVDGVLEAVLLSTCNRTEGYVVVTDDCNGTEALGQFLADYHGFQYAQVEQYLYSADGEEVVRHLFQVAASLDSMVLGEAQILGQLKEAYDHAFVARATGRVFNKLFRQSFEVGKRVRTETAIGAGAVNIAYAAIELAKERVFETLVGRSALIIGAGDMSELAATHLKANGVNELMVANRTFARAEELAARFVGRAVPFEDRYQWLAKVDIVVSATAANEYVITHADLAPAVARRRDPLFMIDIAVPRDIDPDCADYVNVILYDVDALDGVVAATQAERAREAKRAEAIVEEEIRGFERWLEVMEVEPTIAAMRAKAEAIRSGELARAMKRLGGLSDEQQKTVEMLTQSITNKMLHDPTRHLREASEGQRGVAVVETARYLYDIAEPEDSNTGFRLITRLLGRRPRAVTDPAD
ncbi:MAG: glutamyl-tRNA reductase [Actinomycetes bacterium]|jgi:glutamyl-tRNA reductase|nr:glutamyl-tRNA reductase [Actinomycetes bacterium]